MVDYVIDGTTLTTIADKIRSTLGESDLITPESMPIKIEDCYNKGVSDNQVIEDMLVTNPSSATYYKNDRVTQIGVGAFYHCYVKVLEFPNVTNIGQWAFYKAKSTSILCPKAEYIGYEAFYYADAMTEIDLPLVKDVPGDGFLYCSKLQKVKLDSCKTIGNLGFAYCAALTDVYVPLVTSVGNTAFYGCAFTTLDLPSCTSIGTSAFSACGNMSTLILRASTVCTLANTNAFTGTRITSSAGNIYVLDALVDQYKAATNWSTFANQIKPISELG